MKHMEGCLWGGDELVKRINSVANDLRLEKFWGLEDLRGVKVADSIDTLQTSHPPKFKSFPFPKAPPNPKSSIHPPAIFKSTFESHRKSFLNHFNSSFS
jgi:hypothetical protein